MSGARILPSEAGEPTCHCGRLAEDGDVVCGQCDVRRYQSLDDTCCPPRTDE